MLLRVLTACVLIPVIVALVWSAPTGLLAAAAAAVSLLALAEFLDLGERLGFRAFRKWTMACSAAVFYAQYSMGLIETRSLGEGVSIVRNAAGGVVSVEAVLLIFVFGCAGIGLATRRPLHDILPAVSIGSAGILFIAFPFSYLVRMKEMETVGRQIVLFTLCLVWAGDILAYFVGHWLGRVPMAPAISPKKTWEGALGNLVASLLVAVIFARWMQAEVLEMLVIAALGNIAGQMGDLIESVYKRGAAVKDSGTLLPGHGGMLDRIDSLILASPIVWAAFQWMLQRQ
ncbi:MAG: phosphatidate cytidylyltransferase [Candidatus Acidiferrales bacterium]